MVGLGVPRLGRVNLVLVCLGVSEKKVFSNQFTGKVKI